MSSLTDQSDPNNRFSRRDFIRLGVGAAAGMLSAPFLENLAWAADKPPNIIFILADDLGWGDLGCYGHTEIKTPNLDGLAKQGVRFTNFYVCGSVCSPSRAAFTTGQFPARVKIHDYLRYPLTPGQQAAGVAPFLDPKVPTLARILKQSGYATAHFGKWHLGSSPDAPVPSNYGFDTCRTCVSPARPDWPDWGEEQRRPFFWARSTGLFVDEAIKFVEQNKDKPFYINLWTLVPHAPLNPTEEQTKPYERFRPRGVPDRGTKLVYESTVGDMDAQIGRLLAKLDELKLTDNTIVLFTSDNGPEEIALTEAAHSGIGSPGPFRGRKRSLYDGGIREPFIVRWPGVVPAGKVDDTSVVAAVDFLPTLAKAAGARLPDGIRLDGEDVADILRGGARRRNTTLYWEYRFPMLGHPMHHSPQLAIRENNWKLLMNQDGSRIELYDVGQHRTEFDNVADQHPDVAKRLSEKLLAWKKTLPPGEYAPNSGSDAYPWPK